MLLVWWNTLLVLDLCLDIVHHIGLDFKGDHLLHECLDENLHPSMEMQDEMEGRLHLNAVVRKGVAIFELLSGEDKTLLVRRDTFLVLDLHLHIVNGVRRLDLMSNCFPGSEGLNEDLHTATAHRDGGQGGGQWTPSGCCSPKGYACLQGVFQRR